MEDKQAVLKKWLTLFVIISGSFMVSLDMSIVNLAISKMMSAFNSTIDQIQWVLSAYTLALGVATPVTGYLSDRFGIKRIFIIALILFTSASFLCGISWNTASMIIFRVIQGLGGGLIIPLAMTLLMNSFEKGERDTFLAVFGLVSMAAPAIGPTLGGYIIEKLHWTLIFYINIPIGITGVILAIIILNESVHKASSKPFDWIGFLTSSTGLGSLLYVLGKNNIDWADIKNILLLITGCYCLLMFVVNELMIPEPMLNLRLLKNYTFCMSNIIMNIGLLALYGGVFLVPIFLQQLRGLSPMQAGMVLFPEAIATAFGMILSSKLSGKMGVRVFAILALVLLAFNSYSLSNVTLDTSTTKVMLLLMIRGIGAGFLMAPVQLAGLNAVSKEMMSNATALLNTMKQIGAAVGITIITSIMQNRNAFNYADLSVQVNAFNSNSMNLLKTLQGALMQTGLSPSEAQGGAIRQIFGMVAKQAQLQAINDTMLVIAFISVLIILPTLLLRENKNADGVEVQQMSLE